MNPLEKIAEALELVAASLGEERSVPTHTGATAEKVAAFQATYAKVAGDDLPSSSAAKLASDPDLTAAFHRLTFVRSAPSPMGAPEPKIASDSELGTEDRVKLASDRFAQALMRG